MSPFNALPSRRWFVGGLVAAVLLVGAMPGQAQAEPTLQQVFDHVFGPGTVSIPGGIPTVNPPNDTERINGPAGRYEVTVIARCAAATADIGWYPTANPFEGRQTLFSAVPGDAGDLDFPFCDRATPSTLVDIPEEFGLWLSAGGPVFSSDPGLNSDGFDHFVMYKVPGGGFAIGIEDISGGGDQDFQDAVLFVVPVAPVVTAIEPNALLEHTTTDVTVNGTTFMDGDTVDFGPRVQVNSVSFVDSTKLIANVTVLLPVGETGEFCTLSTASFDATVTHSDGGSSTLEGAGTIVPDCDGDGVPDVPFAGRGPDNCPFTRNPEQHDSDLDGIGDACDNCPDVANSDQLDSVGNGVGDGCRPQKTITLQQLTPPGGALFGESVPVQVSVTFDCGATSCLAFCPNVYNLAFVVTDVTNPGTPIELDQTRIWDGGPIHTTNDASLVAANTPLTCSATVDLAQFFPLEPNRTYEVDATYFNYATDGLGDYVRGTIQTPPQTIQVGAAVPSLTGALAVKPEALGVTFNSAPIPSVLHAVLCNLSGGHAVTEVDRTTVRLNGTLAPLKNTLLTSSPGCTGNAVDFQFDMAAVIASVREAAGHPLIIGTQETLLLGGRLSSGAVFTAIVDASDTVLIDEGAIDLIIELIQLLRGMALSPTITNTLTAKLQAILSNPRNIPIACGLLNEFIAAVRLLRGKTIPVVKADALINQANRIKLVLGC